MLNYQEVREQDAELLRRYYAGCDYGLCEYSAGTKLMWRDVLHPTWAEAAIERRNNAAKSFFIRSGII